MLKPLLLALGALVAALAALTAAIVVALMGMVYLFARRSFHRRQPAGTRPPVVRRPGPAGRDEAIDIVATEVPAERLPR